MATNFSIKSMNDGGAVIRIHFDNRLIDCRWPKEWEDTQRMPWLKQTANEVLQNIGHPELLDLDPDTLPEADPEELAAESVSTQPTWWDRIKSFFT